MFFFRDLRAEDRGTSKRDMKEQEDIYVANRVQTDRQGLCTDRKTDEAEKEGRSQSMLSGAVFITTARLYICSVKAKSINLLCLPDRIRRKPEKGSVSV